VNSPASAVPYSNRSAVGRAHLYHGSIILRYLLGRRVFGERMQGL